MGVEQWQVAGNAAQVYERQLVPAIFGPWAPRVLGLAAPAAGERVLDAACGTGVVARLAAERVGADGRVVGFDLNPGMLMVARSLPVGGAPIGWVQATAGRLPFQDSSFEVVCCQLGLQFFPDRAAALAEMARVLVPGGRLVAMVWRSIDHSPGFAVLAAALDRHIGPAAGALMRAPFGLGAEGALRGLVAGAGFREVKLDRQAGVVRFGSARELVVAYGAGSPLAGPIGAAGPPPGRGWWPRSRPGWTHGRGRLGWPSQSRRCWSAAAGRRGRGRLLGCLAGWRRVWSWCAVPEYPLKAT